MSVAFRGFSFRNPTTSVCLQIVPQLWVRGGDGMKGNSQGPETAFLQYVHMFRNKKWAFSRWDELITDKQSQLLAGREKKSKAST
jgi:hypothetical protein